jgi:hypothetical protein
LNNQENGDRLNTTNSEAEETNEYWKKNSGFGGKRESAKLAKMGSSKDVAKND